MEERVRLAGEQCELTTRPNHGGRIRVVLPLQPEQGAAGATEETAMPVRTAARAKSYKPRKTSSKTHVRTVR